MLSQPLLTEEGFLNQACINELNKALTNMPKTYNRLKDDIEWNSKKWIFKDNITGAFAKWAIGQSPYACPDNLEKVVNYLDACLEREIDWDRNGMAELSLCDINKLLYDILYEQGIIYFDDWNKTKKDWRKTEFNSIREAKEKDPDYDFIDLDALLRNVCLDIRTERRENDRFDKKFEEEYGEVNEE